MDQERFLWACAQVMEARPGAGGIGTLKEKTLHAALKLYLEPDPLCREVGVGRFVADIVNPQGIMEIQTGGFGRLREKLDFFLKAYPVTLVYPVAGVKWLISVSQEGTMSQKRKSPKPGGPWEILPELYRIRPLLGRPGLGFCVPVLEVEEYRLKDGRGRRGFFLFAVEGVEGFYQTEDHKGHHQEVQHRLNEAAIGDGGGANAERQLREGDGAGKNTENGHDDIID